MNQPSDREIKPIESQIQFLMLTVKSLAQQQKGDSQGLLLLLRALEQLHRDIREQMFEPSLPSTRKDLYNLLKDIDETGGWPYIERMKIKTLLANWLTEPTISKEAISTPETLDASEPDD